MCGMTREADALAAARLGADAIGLVFHEPSPRAVGVEQAARIVTRMPAFVTTVGLFVDAPAERIHAVLEAVPLDLLQFHGEESPEDCARFDRPWYKAIRMHPDVDLHTEARRYADARALLVDAWMAGVPGGTGATFDWQRIPPDLARPVVLAGGLTPDNVAGAIARVRPWAVDVSGGIEQPGTDGRPRHGYKSEQAMAEFMRGVTGD